MRMLVIHGPNLNLLGEREPERYGTKTLADIDALIRKKATDLQIDVRCEQHSGEGAIVDALHNARAAYDAIVLNPGAYAHYAHAIADAIASISTPVIEVHLTNTASRETFRRTSVIAPVCAGTIAGFGANSYILAMHAAAALVAEKKP